MSCAPADAAGRSRLSRHGECIAKHDPQPSTQGRPVGIASTDTRPAPAEDLHAHHPRCQDHGQDTPVDPARQRPGTHPRRMPRHPRPPVRRERLERPLRPPETAARRRGPAAPPDSRPGPSRAEHHEEYDYGPDRTPGETRPAAIIRHAPPSGASRYPELGRAFGCYVQTVASAPFHGKRLSIRADLRCEAVTHAPTSPSKRSHAAHVQTWNRASNDPRGSPPQTSTSAPEHHVRIPRPHVFHVWTAPWRQDPQRDDVSWEAIMCPAFRCGA